MPLTVLNMQHHNIPFKVSQSSLLNKEIHHKNTKTKFQLLRNGACTVYFTVYFENQLSTLKCTGNIQSFKKKTYIW